MSWRTAFIQQARSDNRVRLALPRTTEYCHRLHYLQMVTEKMAKGFQMRDSDADPPPATHQAFVGFLRSLKTRPEIRRRLGYTDRASFRALIDSLLDTAMRIERLAPSAAGSALPNPEYPWRDVVTGEVIVPAEFSFTLFNPRDARMAKIEDLLSALLRMDLGA